MNKDQFRIQIYHNRYTRGVVVTICKILIWSLIYALIVAIFGSVMATSMGVQAQNIAAYDVEQANIGVGTVISALIIVIVTIAYYWAVIAAILRKIRQNKQLSKIEDEYLGSKSTK